MKKILYIDATIRENSRTALLSRYLLKKLDGEIIPVRLCDTILPSLDCETLSRRDEDKERNCFDAPYYDNAHALADADIVVIAAPFWDNSFPAVLKKYIESVCINGLTFRYGEKGIPVGMCRAEKFYYISTAGGYISLDAEGFCYGYIKSILCSMFGIKDSQFIKAEGLDIYGADIGAILDKAKAEIDGLFE